MRNIFTYRCHDFLVPMYSKLTHERIVVLDYDTSNLEKKVYQYRSPLMKGLLRGAVGFLSGSGI